MTLDERLSEIDTVTEYQDVIQECERRMQHIRSSCQHPDYELTMWSYRPGAYYPCRMCKLCRYPITGITQEEIDSTWEDFNSSLNVAELEDQDGQHGRS
jgi:hypothetical protein